MKKWISAARLRTLPLALSSIFMGGALAYSYGMFRQDVFLWALITTLLLQIFSNFANDYGDSFHGADSEHRVGPQRATQSGAISPQQMFKGVVVLGLLSFISGLYLLFLSLSQSHIKYFLLFLALGILSIAAAFKYTAGSKPYGYAGLGDISVFLFFGLTGVLGSYFLLTNDFDWPIILPAVSLGCLSTAVLNINNIRDRTSDEKAGKITIPVRLGSQKAIIYHWILLGVAMLCTVIYIEMKNGSWYYLLSFPLIILNGVQVTKSNNPDPYLKTLALTTVFFVIVFGLSLI